MGDRICSTVVSVKRSIVLVMSIVSYFVGADKLVFAQNAAPEAAAPPPSVNDVRAIKAYALPTQLGGAIPQRDEWQAEYNLRVKNGLNKALFSVLDAVPLTDTEKLCHDQKCLAAIAETANADVVVASRVFLDEQTPPNYRVSVWMFDRAKPDAVFTKEKICPNCAEFQSAEALSDVLGEALRPLAKSPYTIDVAQDRNAPKKKWALRGISIGLGALGVTGIILGAVEAADYHDRVGTDRVRDTKPGMITGFVGGGVLLLAGGIVAYFGWHHDHNEQKVTVYPTLNGGAMSVKF